MRQLLTKRWLIVSVVVVAAGVVVTGWAWAAGSSSTAAPSWVRHPGTIRQTELATGTIAAARRQI
jgi:hypothetical protein